MDLWIIVMVFALIYFLSSGIQNRRKERQRAEEERPDAPETPPMTQETHEAVDQAADAGYDYGEFRKKLRQAWKLPGPEESQEKDEDQVYTEPERSVERQPVPVPVPQMEKNERAFPSAERPKTAADAYNEEQRRRWQQYAEESREAPEHTVQKLAAANEEPSRKVWTEKDAEQWIRYDAVFGEPRSKKPWSPAAGGRGHV